MIALIQRVTQARVTVADQTIGAIGTGLLAMICAQRGDSEQQADAMLSKLLAYRVFADENGRMNRSLTDVMGGLLLIPQFTLAADTHAGTRPSLTPAAEPAEGRRLYEHFVSAARRRHAEVESGAFGATMQVELVNDGPVTFWLQIHPPHAPRSTR